MTPHPRSLPRDVRTGPTVLAVLDAAAAGDQIRLAVAFNQMNALTVTDVFTQLSDWVRTLTSDVALARLLDATTVALPEESAALVAAAVARDSHAIAALSGSTVADAMGALLTLTVALRDARFRIDPTLPHACKFA